MIFETAIEIKFNCFVPDGLIIPGSKGTFLFPEIDDEGNKAEPVYTTKKFEAEALTDFLDIPRLVSISPEFMGEDLPKAGPMQRVKQSKKRSDAREAFYKKWGFLTASNKNARASETEAEFDAIHLELCNVNDQRKTNELKSTSNFRFNPPSTASWTVRDYGQSKIPVPVYETKDLASALYLYWFFAPKEMSSLKTCQRFVDHGPKIGCQVFFSDKSNKKYCCETCKKNSTARRLRSKQEGVKK